MANRSHPSKTVNVQIPPLRGQIPTATKSVNYNVVKMKIGGASIDEDRDCALSTVLSSTFARSMSCDSFALHSAWRSPDVP
jgi:hypothetical protein